MVLIGLIIALLLIFHLLAKICSDHFVPALDKIADHWKLSSDVAGATLMAIGSSAPELFVAIFSVIIPGDHEAIGMGNIVGSAIFNILVIIGATAIVKKAVISWQPALRDMVFYSLSVGLLILFFYNGYITIFEGSLLILLYIVYVIAVVNWHKILPHKDQPKNEEPDLPEEKLKHGLSKLVAPIDYIVDKLFPPSRHYYINFLISIIIIALLSLLLVESAIKISFILNIPEAIIALTVLAIGTSIPDMFSSIIVAKQGREDMAISNAIGSNIFDILVGLGIPFIIMIAINGGTVKLKVDDLLISVLLLQGSVLVLFFIFLINRWHIGKKAGYTLMILYLFYLIWEIYNLYFTS